MLKQYYYALNWNDTAMPTVHLSKEITFVFITLAVFFYQSMLKKDNACL